VRTRRWKHEAREIERLDQTEGERVMAWDSHCARLCVEAGRKTIAKSFNAAANCIAGLIDPDVVT
jgi:hypothetical protein